MSAVQPREPDRSGTLVPGGPLVAKAQRAEGITDQIRYGQVPRYGAERGDVASKLGDVHHDRSAETPGGYGASVTAPEDIGSALWRGRESGKAPWSTSGWTRTRSRGVL